MIEQTSNKINRMLQEMAGDSSEAYQFARYRLNQFSQEMAETFESEKRQIQNKLEQAEVEFIQQLRHLQEKE
ncbi:MAG: hypothetical protein LBS33_03645 [Streptococcaceae bacterium]|nr:hypothetical protein [Streptococcaceae bacterium]